LVLLKETDSRRKNEIFFLKQNIKDYNLGMSIIKEKKHIAVRIFKNLLLKLILIYFHELKLQSKGKSKTFKSEVASQKPYASD